MYNHITIEKKWSKYWSENKTFKFVDDPTKEKFYVLDMFPYPSGAGLHVGHPKGYTASDVISRYKRLNNFNVLHPIGWDAFGLPAEQYAIQTNNHPKIFTYKNIDNFRKQLQMLGFDFDYDKEVCTCDEKFYKWTQWIFIQLYKNDLAFIEDCDVNWCENLKIVLANEEIVKDANGNYVSERGNHPITKRKMKQWVLKITKFADELISGLDLVDWNDGLKNIQKKWIGKTSGSIVEFAIENQSDFKIPVFVAKIEQLNNLDFIPIAVDSLIVDQLVKNPGQEIIDFIEQAKNQKDYERTNIERARIGIKIDVECINPINNKSIPIVLVDYILPNFASGVGVGIPNQDKKDFELAKMLQIKISEKNDDENQQAIIDRLKALNIYHETTAYKLKDWLFSRQRYWGEPFPVLFDNDGKILIDENLPLKLPQIENFSPSNDGKSPLNNALEWLHVAIENINYTRDTNTMPQWAGSCWYYIAYILKNDDGTYTDLDSNEAKQRLSRWLPVDVYIGGQEHAVLHLLYARFWHRFLYKIGVLDKPEPFQKMINQGMILDPIGQKISKSVGNVIAVEEIIDEYGADALRLYEMFMGPLTQSAKWSNDAINGVKLWLNKIYRIYESAIFIDDDELLKHEFNEMIFHVTENIDNLQFNIAISKMMVFTNACAKLKQLPSKYMEQFLVILSCFAPFISQELYFQFFNKEKQIAFANWPQYDEKLLTKENIKLPIQINGKVRDIIECNVNDDQAKVRKLIMQSEKIVKLIENQKIKKEIFVVGKIYNFII